MKRVFYLRPHARLESLQPCRQTAEARADVFDYIERFHNPRMQRRLDAEEQAFILLTQPSVKKG